MHIARLIVVSDNTHCKKMPMAVLKKKEIEGDVTVSISNAIDREVSSTAMVAE